MTISIRPKGMLLSSYPLLRTTLNIKHLFSGDVSTEVREKRQTEVRDDRKVVCYYANWAVYRQGDAKFTPQNINPYLCTHLIYAFGGLGKDDTLVPFDEYQDIEKGEKYLRHCVKMLIVMAFTTLLILMLLICCIYHTSLHQHQSSRSSIVSDHNAHDSTLNCCLHCRWIRTVRSTEDIQQRSQDDAGHWRLE